MIKALLQGKPFRHPLHPALVHFPIGLFILALLMDVLSYLGVGSGELPRASFYALAGGLVLGLLAAVAGLADRSDIRRDHPARKTANIHMTLNLIALGLFAVNLWLRLGETQPAGISLLDVLLSSLGVGVLLVSGYLGGTMVYDDGIGVGRHRRDTRTPSKTFDVSVFERQDGLVPVCDEDQIKDGETLRVDWNGKIITLARQAGKVYAFQEFCTHRYGPLSEGKLYDNQVECPWHRSCFDIRTGKVVEGPAKVDLKTYATLVRAGKIFIQ
ncbi:MAG: Rieske 2Fe-2S domain-containing protein [Chloroflexota bacterium]|nr:Rieske 2Fe-2S domain-containing protein [Chloroflexota bacterium]